MEFNSAFKVLMMHRNAFTISTDYFVRLPNTCRRWLVLQVPVVIVYRHVCYLKILHSAHTVYLCVFFRPQNKQEEFQYTAVSDWFLQHTAWI